jgi:hypothetical protein
MTNSTLKLILEKEGRCPKCWQEAVLYPLFDDNKDFMMTGHCLNPKCEHEFAIQCVPVYLTKGDTPDIITPVYWREGMDGHTRTAIVMTGDNDEGSIDVVDKDGRLLFRLDITYNIPGKKDAMIMWIGAESDSPVRETNLFGVQDMKNAFQFEFK